MLDDEICIGKIKKEVAKFVKDRNWGKYHDPKNLSMSIAIEAGELMENFQWIKNDECFEISKNDNKFQNVKEELSDVFLYCIRLADILNIDLSKEALEKIKKNEKKYPVEKFNGNFE